MMNDFHEDLEDFSNLFNEIMKEVEDDQESFWNSLSKDDQLKAFCAVMRRLHKGEIEDGGSYRYILYDVFGFGPESYAQAQCAGFLEIHNAIYTNEELKEMIERTKNAKSDDV
jgi:hypothetical protein